MRDTDLKRAAERNASADRRVIHGERRGENPDAGNRGDCIERSKGLALPEVLGMLYRVVRRDVASVMECRGLCMTAFPLD